MSLFFLYDMSIVTEFTCLQLNHCLGNNCASESYLDMVCGDKFKLMSPIFPLNYQFYSIHSSQQLEQQASTLRGRQQLFMGVLFMHWAQLQVNSHYLLEGWHTVSTRLYHSNAGTEYPLEYSRRKTQTSSFSVQGLLMNSNLQVEWCHSHTMK